MAEGQSSQRKEGPFHPNKTPNLVLANCFWERSQTNGLQRPLWWFSFVTKEPDQIRMTGFHPGVQPEKRHTSAIGWRFCSMGVTYIGLPYNKSYIFLFVLLIACVISNTLIHSFVFWVVKLIFTHFCFCELCPLKFCPFFVIKCLNLPCLQGTTARFYRHFSS